MTTMVVTMLLGWFLGMFGWMAIAAIVAVFLIYVFKGKQAAAVAGVVIVAVLIGLRSFPGWRSLGGPGRVLTAKEQKALEHARKVKHWKKWNKGGEEEVNKAAAAMAAESDAMGAMGGPLALPMPQVSTPHIQPPTWANPGGLATVGSPGSYSRTAIQGMSVGAAAPAPMASQMVTPRPMLAATTAGPSAGNPGTMTLPVAITGLVAKDNTNAATKPKATPSQGDGTTLPSATPIGLKKAAAGGGKPSSMSNPAGGSSASSQTASPKGSVMSMAASPRQSQASDQTTQPPAQGRTPPAGQPRPSPGGSGTAGTNQSTGMVQNSRPSRQGTGQLSAMGDGTVQPNRAPSPRRRYRPHYQPTGEDSAGLMAGSAGQSHRYSAQGYGHGGGAGQHAETASRTHRHHYQSTEDHAPQVMMDAQGNLHMGMSHHEQQQMAAHGQMGHGGQASQPMGGTGQYPQHPMSGMQHMGGHPMNGPHPGNGSGRRVH